MVPQHGSTRVGGASLTSGGVAVDNAVSIDAIRKVIGMSKQKQAQKHRLSSPPWHLLEPWQTTAWLKVDADQGLSHEEVSERLAVFGPNAIREERRRGPVRMFFGQFADFMIIVLILAGIVSGLIGDLTDAIAIVVIVVLNALIGFIQEFRAERAVAALRRLASPTAQVVRNSQLQTASLRKSWCRAMWWFSRPATSSRPTSSCWTWRGSRWRRPR